MPDTTEAAEDKANRELFLKTFGFMTTFTAVISVIIVASCLLYKKANCDSGTAPASFMFEIVCRIIGSGTDKDKPGWLGFLICITLFGWFVTTTMYVLTSRVMIDIFNATPLMEKIKSYAVYPALFIIGLILVLGVVMFIPMFGLSSFVDSKMPTSSDNAANQGRERGLLDKLITKLGLDPPFKILRDNFANLVRFASFVGLGGVVAAAVAAIVALLMFIITNHTSGVISSFKAIVAVLGIIVAITAVLSAYNLIAKTERDYQGANGDSIPLFILKVLKYIPCFILDVVDAVKREFKLTTKPVWILLAVESVLIGLYFLTPIVMQATVYKNSLTVLPGVSDLSKYRDLGSLENVGIVRTSECSNKTKRKYDYAFSAWLFFSPHPPSVAKGSSKFVPVFDVNGTPTVSYRASTNELQFTLRINERGGEDEGAAAQAQATGASVTDTNAAADYEYEYDAEEPADGGRDAAPSQAPKDSPPVINSVVVHTIQNVPLQRWNHLFYNYDGANIDIFLNNELVVTLTDYVPAIEYGGIKCGAPSGVIGNIANVTVFNHSVTKNVISGIYMSHKDSSPPVA
jgi:hypothetical protein